MSYLKYFFIISSLLLNALNSAHALTATIKGQKLFKASLVSAKVSDFAASITWKLPAKPDYAKALLYRKAYSLPVVRDDSKKGSLDLGELIAELDIKQQRYGDADLKPHVRYYYRIILVNADGQKSAPSLPAIVSLKDVTAPDKVSDVKLKVLDEQNISIRWLASPSQDVQSYRVLRALKGERSMMIQSVPIKDKSQAIYQAKITQKRDVGLTYYYSIAAVDAVGNVSKESERKAVRLKDNKAPRSPLLVTLKQDDKAILVQWRANDEDDLQGYHVYRKEDQLNTHYVRLNQQVLKQTFFKDQTIQGLKNYRYRVTAVDNFANESQSSKGLPIRTRFISTLIQAPHKLLIKATKKGFPHLSWAKQAKSSSVLKAILYRSDGGRFKALTPLLSSNDFVDRSIRLHQSYQYQVRYVTDIGRLSAGSNTVLWTGAKP